MNYKEHWMLGFAVSIGFVVIMNYFFKWFEMNILGLLPISIVIFIFSILPDIDSRASQIVWIAIGAGVIGLILSVVDRFVYDIPWINNSGLVIASTALLLFTYICAIHLGHRGPTHGAIFGIILSVILIWPLTQSWQLCILGFVAYLSHLWGDGYVFKVW